MRMRIPSIATHILSSPQWCTFKYHPGTPSYTTTYILHVRGKQSAHACGDLQLMHMVYLLHITCSYRQLLSFFLLVRSI